MEESRPASETLVSFKKALGEKPAAFATVEDQEAMERLIQAP